MLYILIEINKKTRLVNEEELKSRPTEVITTQLHLLQLHKWQLKVAKDLEVMAAVAQSHRLGYIVRISAAGHERRLGVDACRVQFNGVAQVRLVAVTVKGAEGVEKVNVLYQKEKCKFE